MREESWKGLGRQSGGSARLACDSVCVCVRVCVQGTGRPLQAGAFTEIPEGVFSRATATFVKGGSLCEYKRVCVCV